MIIGVLGGGQLAKMLAQAAPNLALEIYVYDANPHSCAFADSRHICASFENTHALTRFAQECNLITCEFENIPTSALELVSKYCPCLPSAEVFAIGSNRIKEKSCFDAVGITVPNYLALNSGQDCIQASEAIGFPLMAKTASGGYDGKGQKRCDNLAQLKEWFTSLGGRAAIAEELVDFDHEISQLITRNSKGETLAYPPVYIHQHQGVLHLAMPCPNHPLTKQAKYYAELLANRLKYVGILALEMFVLRSGKLLANEFSPRVHNSGHWSIEGTTTSQFTQHLLAICAKPLGQVELTQQCIMINCLGKLPRIKSDTNSHFHDYGKEVRPGRKLGHITLTQAEDETTPQLLDRTAAIYQTLYGLPLPKPLDNLTS